MLPVFPEETGKSQVTAYSIRQGFVSLEEIWLPLAATCQFQQLFAA